MKDEELLKAIGWTIICESPFEIQHEDGSIATNWAAQMILTYIKAVGLPSDLIQICDLDIHVGTYNLLSALGVDYIQDLSLRRRDEIIKHRKCSTKILKELEDVMNQHNINWII